MNLIDTLLEIRPRHLAEGLYWLIFHSIGALFPLWGSWIGLAAFSQPVGWATFTEHGEFALYSAALISAGIYVITKDNAADPISRLLQLFHIEPSRESPRGTFPGMRIFLIVFVFFLPVSVLLFAAATFAHLPEVPLSLDVPLVTSVTVTIFVVSLVACYVITVLDVATSSRSEAELRKILSSQETDLEVKFRLKQRGA